MISAGLLLFCSSGLKATLKRRGGWSAGHRGIAFQFLLTLPIISVWTRIKRIFFLFSGAFPWIILDLILNHLKPNRTEPDSKAKSLPVTKVFSLGITGGNAAQPQVGWSRPWSLRPCCWNTSWGALPSLKWCYWIQPSSCLMTIVVTLAWQQNGFHLHSSPHTLEDGKSPVARIREWPSRWYSSKGYKWETSCPASYQFLYAMREQGMGEQIFLSSNRLLVRWKKEKDKKKDGDFQKAPGPGTLANPLHLSELQGFSLWDRNKSVSVFSNLLWKSREMMNSWECVL